MATRRTTRSRVTRMAALGAGLALTFAACGDDDDGDSNDTEVDVITSEITVGTVVTSEVEVSDETTVESVIEVTEETTQISEVVQTEP